MKNEQGQDAASIDGGAPLTSSAWIDGGAPARWRAWALALALGAWAGALLAVGSSPRAQVPAWTTAELRQVQEKLRDLGFWMGATKGIWNEPSRQALVAFQKTEWRQPTGLLTRAEFDEVLRGFAPVPRETGTAHIEVDLARQILFMVSDSGAVSHILPISSGSGRHFRAPGWEGTADTPCGHFTVFAKASGWQRSPLGEMHNPMYLVGGIAIHGSASVPAKPVSHGCIRIPMYASQTLTRLVPRETPVTVYGCADEAPPAPVQATAAGAESALKNPGR